MTNQLKWVYKGIENPQPADAQMYWESANILGRRDYSIKKERVVGGKRGAWLYVLTHHTIEGVENDISPEGQSGFISLEAAKHEAFKHAHETRIVKIPDVVSVPLREQEYFDIEDDRIIYIASESRDAAILVFSDADDDEGLEVDGIVIRYWDARRPIAVLTQSHHRQVWYLYLMVSKVNSGEKQFRTKDAAMEYLAFVLIKDEQMIDRDIPDHLRRYFDKTWKETNGSGDSNE